MRLYTGILLSLLILSGCSKPVVSDLSTNIGRFQHFMTNLQNGKKDQIRIIQYTVEGDPIFFDLDYNGQTIHYTFDNTKDAFGGNGRRKQSTDCSKVEMGKKESGTTYTLTGCNSEIGNTFSFFVPR